MYLAGKFAYVICGIVVLNSSYRSLRHCRDLFTRAFKAKLLDRIVQPAYSGSFIDSFAGFDQEGRGLRTRCRFVRFAYRRQFLVMLESPVHVDTASSAILDVVLIRHSALWTLYHDRPLSIILSRLDQAMAYGFCDCLRSISDLQLPVNILHLTFDLDLTPKYLLSDLFIRPSLCCKSH